MLVMNKLLKDASREPSF